MGTVLSGTGVGVAVGTEVQHGAKPIGAVADSAGWAVQPIDRCSPSEPQRDTITHSKRGGQWALISFARMATTKPRDRLSDGQPNWF